MVFLNDKIVILSHVKNVQLSMMVKFVQKYHFYVNKYQKTNEQLKRVKAVHNSEIFDKPNDFGRQRW